jgi:xanthine phosphoribosyltransferase
MTDVLNTGDAYTGKQHITWQDVQDDCFALAELLEKSGPVQGLVGIARGGLVPTAIVAHRLDIRNVKTVAVTSYFGRQQVTAEVLGSVEEIKDGEGWVFIDDLTDTGQTAKLIKKRYPKAKFAAVYAKPEGQEFVDYFVKLLKAENWIVYPWEKDE